MPSVATVTSVGRGQPSDVAPRLVLAHPLRLAVSLLKRLFRCETAAFLETLLRGHRQERRDTCTRYRTHADCVLDAGYSDGKPLERMTIDRKQNSSESLSPLTVQTLGSATTTTLVQKRYAELVLSGGTLALLEITHSSRLLFLIRRHPEELLPSLHDREHGFRSPLASLSYSGAVTPSSIRTGSHMLPAGRSARPTPILTLLEPFQHGRWSPTAARVG